MSIGARLFVLGVGGPVSLLLLGSFFQAIREDPSIYVAAGLIVLCGAGVAAIWMARRITRQLSQLDLAARQIAEGDFTVRAATKDANELSQLNRDFNFMAERLEAKATRFNELDNLRSEFVGRVSHELRTPLTTIKALTRLLLREDITDEKRREYLETISIECDRQIDLVLNLLDLSRIEGNGFRLELGRVDVADIISSCVKAYTAAAKRRGHRLQIEPFNTVPSVCADPKTLRRVVNNLIENSIKYTPDGGLITVSAGAQSDHVAIRVTDNGRGIPPEDLPVLFDKFHRGRPAASSSTAAISDADFLADADISGVGLGLYLAKDVIERMGGRISVETEVGRGSIFTVHLPIWNAGDCPAPVDE